MNGRSREVVGVMPREFRVPLDYRASRPTDLFTAAVIDGVNLGQWGNRSYLAVARLRPGVTGPPATSEMSVIHDQWVRAGYIRPSEPQQFNRSAVSMQDFVTGGVERALVILMVAVGAVLLIACANVANLLLARADARRREVALRGALGADRYDIIKLLLTESVVLAMAGAVAGLAFAAGALQVLTTLRTTGCHESMMWRSI